MRAIFSICLVLLTGLVSPGNAQAEGGGAFTVFVTRHAEKADTSRDAELSDAGRSRAAYLAKLLQDADVEYVHSTDFKRTRVIAVSTFTVGPCNIIGAFINAERIFFSCVCNVGFAGAKVHFMAVDVSGKVARQPAYIAIRVNALDIIRRSFVMCHYYRLRVGKCC